MTEVRAAPQEAFVFPVAYAQQRLWFLEQLVPGTGAYNVPLAVRVRGELDTAVLERALGEVVRRHEALRTTFAAVDGQPVQVVAAAGALALAREELGGLPAERREAEARRRAAAAAARPFDLARGPLLRAVLYRLDEADHVALLVVHHLVADGWSLGVLLHELATLYAAFTAGQPSPLPELPIQYADYAAWQRQWLRASELERQLAYWRQRLAEARSPLALPTDRPRPPVPSFRGATQRQRLAAEVLEVLRVLGRQEGATLFMVLLAAFAVLLRRHSGQDDLVVGTDVANRTSTALEGLIGFFVNLVPLRIELDGDPSFRQLLRRVRRAALDAFAHPEVPFDRLVRELRPGRSLGQAPLVQVLFVLQNTPLPTVRLPGLTCSPFEVDHPVARFDLALFAQESDDGLILRWNYSSDLFDDATIGRMTADFAGVLVGIAADPDARLRPPGAEAKDTQEVRSMDRHERPQASLKQFLTAKPKALTLSEQQLVRTEPLRPDGPMPLLVTPAVEDLDLADWARGNRPFLEAELLEHGALLFRGFRLASVAQFQEFAAAVCPDLFGDYGDLPREREGDRIYAATPYPADQAILFHNESSHTRRWPMKQWFFCVTPAAQGGETTIVDCRRLYRGLDPPLRARLEEKRLRYIRNYIPGLDVSWQDFFKTTERSAVEEHCREAGVEFCWKDGGVLQTRTLCPAIARHPKTWEHVFFNQIQLHHPACLDAVLRASLRSSFAEEDLPRDVTFGDGSPIEDEVVSAISDLYWRTAVRFPWQTGDVLMVDNMLVAHARLPYVGPRKIVVAMGEMMTADALT